MSPDAAGAADARWMGMALGLARQGLGQTSANPSVGCVIVRDDQVVGLGHTQPGGRPHAETVALEMAGEAARGATVYVTLEPCSHQGKTPPCAGGLAAAGVARVVVACGDPDARVNGAGIAQLREAGIAVELGLREAEAAEGLAGFLSRLRRGRPWVMLKLATSQDGFIADAAGQSQWITGEAARLHAMLRRAEVDAILTGIGTVLADDPLLTCRLPGLSSRSPQRVVLEGRRKLPATARLGEALRLDGRVGLPAVLGDLAERGINRLLVEAGSAVAGSFWQSGLVDELYWYRAPLVLGAGLPALGGVACNLAEASRGRLIEQRQLGPDTLTHLRFTDPQTLLQA